MTRNHKQEPYALAGLARAHASAMRQKPIDWARSIHNLWAHGEYAPKKTPGDAEKTIAKVRSTTRADLVDTAIKAIVRGENELRLRALIRAHRLLAESKDPKDQKLARELSGGLASGWGITRANEAVAEGEAELSDKLLAEWGKTQLPPVDATVNGWVADELLIAAAVRRIS